MTTTRGGWTDTPDRPAGTVRRGVALLLGIAAALGVTTAAEAADVPGDKSTRVVFEKGWPYRQGTFERRGDSDWYRVVLTGGRNYAFAINVRNVPYGCARLNLRNLEGKVLKSALSGEGSDAGFEFQPAANRTFFVEFKNCASYAEASFPSEYSASVAADARGDTTTQATLAVGETVNGINNSSDDDYFRMRLEKGKKYTIGAGIDDYIDAEDLNLLIDSSGQVIARNFAGVPSGISVPATGTYYVAHSSFADSARGRYTLRLTTP